MPDDKKAVHSVGAAVTYGRAAGTGIRPVTRYQCTDGSEWSSRALAEFCETGLKLQAILETHPHIMKQGAIACMQMISKPEARDLIREWLAACHRVEQQSNRELPDGESRNAAADRPAR